MELEGGNNVCIIGPPVDMLMYHKLVMTVLSGSQQQQNDNLQKVGQFNRVLSGTPVILKACHNYVGWYNLLV